MDSQGVSTKDLLVNDIGAIREQLAHFQCRFRGDHSIRSTDDMEARKRVRCSIVIHDG